MSLLFVVNPISGGVDKKPFVNQAKALCKKYGIEYSIFETTGKNDEENLQKAVQNFNPAKVASVGGDGTTLFTSLTLLQSGIPIGIVPLGSANGLAVELGVNPTPVEALKDIIMSEKVGGLDMLRVNDKYNSVHIGDVGINANIVNAYEEDPNRGMATYARYFIEEIRVPKKFDVVVKANGEEIKTNVLMLGLCNSRKYGTGVPLNIIGNPMDGKFEIVLIENIDAASLIKAGLSKFDEKFHDSQNSKIISTTAAEITFDTARLLQLDGEVIGKFETLKIEIVQGAIPLITHGNNPYL